MGVAMAEPMYRQIAEDLQRQIASGELPGGTQIPTEIGLREHYQASRHTITVYPADRNRLRIDVGEAPTRQPLQETGEG